MSEHWSADPGTGCGWMLLIASIAVVVIVVIAAIVWLR